MSKTSNEKENHFTTETTSVTPTTIDTQCSKLLLRPVPDNLAFNRRIRSSNCQSVVKRSKRKPTTSVKWSSRDNYDHFSTKVVLGFQIVKNEWKQNNCYAKEKKPELGMRVWEIKKEMKQTKHGKRGKAPGATAELTRIRQTSAGTFALLFLEFK